MRQPVQAVVTLTHRPHEPAERIGLVLAGVSAVLVNLGDLDLYRGVVLGGYEAVGRAALAGDVTISGGWTVSLCYFRVWWVVSSSMCCVGEPVLGDLLLENGADGRTGQRVLRVRSPWLLIGYLGGLDVN